MPLYAVVDAQLRAVSATTFARVSLLERKHLQAMLRQDVSPLGEDLLVLCEEFGNWTDSNRRIDLLCLDKAARLVVVELKRDEDGAHMDLQAIRYAAMVSSMTLDQAIAAHAKQLGGAQAMDSAREAVLEFLELDDGEPAELTGEVRIILASADFSSEITTAVIWLNRQGLDIRCVRLQPYEWQGQVLIDATQIIPLPEAADYEIKVRELQDEKRRVRSSRDDTLLRFWSQFIERAPAHGTPLFQGRSPTPYHWLSTGLGRFGFTLSAVLTKDQASVECYIRIGTNNPAANKAAFHALQAQQAEIEQAFGGPLQWQAMPDKDSCRISVPSTAGGWKSPEADWPALQDWLIAQAVRLEQALKRPIQNLVI